MTFDDDVDLGVLTRHDEQIAKHTHVAAQGGASRHCVYSRPWRSCYTLFAS